MSQTFNYTGHPESLTVPAGALVQIVADGAGGGDLTGCPDAFGNFPYDQPGGTGSRVVTTLATTATTTYTINVASAGGKDCGTGAAGGYNGGGNGGANGDPAVDDTGGGGGGASSISANGTLLVVAGGGGGAGGLAGRTIVPPFLSGGRGGDGGLNAGDGATGNAFLTAKAGGGGKGGSTPNHAPGAGGSGGMAIPGLCIGRNGLGGSSFSGTTVGAGGTGGKGATVVPDACGGGEGGGGGGGGYFGGGGGGASAETVAGLVIHASGGGGGGGSSFATPSGSGTNYGASPVGTANHDGKVTISYSVVAAITATAGTPQSTPINRFFLVRFKATVTDTGGDPVPGVPVTFTAPPLTGPSGTFDLLDTSVVVFTNANGVATAPTFFANGKVGSYTVTASLADGLSIPPASFALTNTGPTTLAIDKSHEGNFIQGQQGVYTITVGNSPGAVPTDGATVTVHDTLPSGLTAASISGTGWTCALNTLTCTRSDVLPGGQNYPDITLTVNVSPTAPAQVTNTATVTGGGDTTTQTATDPTEIEPAPPSLTISKTHIGNFVQGRRGTYTIIVGNNGNGPTDGTTVIMHDTLPSGLTAASISGTGWTCALNTLTCTRSDVLPGGQNYPDITLKVKVSCRTQHRDAATVTGGGDRQVTNTATTTGGGDPTTHTATDPTNINRDKQRGQHKQHHHRRR